LAQPRLVAIDSFADNVKRSIREQSRAVMGGDLAFRARAPTRRQQKAVLDSIAMEPRAVRASRDVSVDGIRSAHRRNEAFADPRREQQLSVLRRDHD
jgi:predicted lysophospholipase L1 biosynthesis ABC-type transport system permease subunit